MLNNIIDKNIMFLQHHGIKMDCEDDKAIYKYGLQILYYYIIDLTVIFSLAYLFGNLYETAIIIFIFGVLQVFGGGYHAKTPLKCLITMIIGAVVGNLFIILIANKLIFNIFLTFIFSIIIFSSKPVTNKKHLVSNKIKNRSKLIVRSVIILILISVLILSYFDKTYEVAVIVVSLGLYLVSLKIAQMNTARENCVLH